MISSEHFDWTREIPLVLNSAGTFNLTCITPLHRCSNYLFTPNPLLICAVSCVCIDVQTRFRVIRTAATQKVEPVSVSVCGEYRRRLLDGRRSQWQQMRTAEWSQPNGGPSNHRQIHGPFAELFVLAEATARLNKQVIISFLWLLIKLLKLYKSHITLEAVRSEHPHWCDDLWPHHTSLESQKFENLVTWQARESVSHIHGIYFTSPSE